MTEVAGKLNSEDVFVLATPATVFLWKGEERRIYILREISLYVSVTVSYSTFDNSFLSGTGSLPNEASVGLKIANILAGDFNGKGEHLLLFFLLLWVLPHLSSSPPFQPLKVSPSL